MSLNFENHVIHFETIRNARDLGGIVTKDGRRMQKKRLIRCGHMIRTNEADMNRLVHEFQCRKVYDFRTSWDNQAKPDTPIPNAQIIWNPILQETETTNFGATMGKAHGDSYDKMYALAKTGYPRWMYYDMIDNPFSQSQYHKFIKEVIQNTSGSVFFHCTAGKDRTGMAAVFLLWMLGCDLDTIYEDYLFTNVSFADDIEETKGIAKEKGWNIRELDGVLALVAIHHYYLEEGLKYIDMKYGSLDEYIENQLKITKEDYEVLRENYLEKKD